MQSGEKYIFPLYRFGPVLSRNRGFAVQYRRFVSTGKAWYVHAVRDDDTCLVYRHVDREREEEEEEERERDDVEVLPL